MKESPLMGYTELECYKVALRLREVLGQKGRLTAKAAAKKTKLSEGQVLKIARVYYPQSIIIVPYGQSARIMMRPLKNQAS
jgi:hypothetical protein